MTPFRARHAPVTCIWCLQHVPNRLIATIAGVSASSVDRYMRGEFVDASIVRSIDRAIARVTQEVPRRAGASATSEIPNGRIAIADAPGRQLERADGRR